jgi:hypothetical protein
MRTCVITLLCAVLAALLWAACVAWATAELPGMQGTVQGLKAPLGGRLQAFPQGGSTQQIKPSASGTPEVTQLGTECAAGGGKVTEIVLTGKNFPGPSPRVEDSKWRFFPQIGCSPPEGAGMGSFRLTVESLTLESPTRAVARVLVPEGKVNADCQLTVYGPGAPLEFHIVNISLSQNLELEARFVGKGNLSLGQILARPMAEPGLLSASPSSVKFVQGGKTLFDQPASSLKTAEGLPGNPMWGFRILFNDGKVYNFQTLTTSSSHVCEGGKYLAVPPAEALKKKFGK